jgi:hypothetical protein
MFKRLAIVIGVAAASVMPLGAQAWADAPPPTQALRDILPMSTGVPTDKPNGTVTPPPATSQITGRPQTLVSINSA